MLAARYAWAASFARDADVLEVACGAGLGLKWLAGVARSVEAGDVDDANCARARGSGVVVRRMDALDLPFEAGSFDLVLLFEALYYLPCAARFFGEARRVLRPGGRLLMTMANPDWSGFNASPSCSRYFSADKLGNALAAGGFQGRVWAAFPEERGRASIAIGWVRRTAARLGWIPKTMRGKAWLKRVFYGPLEVIPQALAPRPFDMGMLKEAARVRLDQYRVLYAEAVK